MEQTKILKEEIEIEQRIKSGEEVEITKAIEIRDMLKSGLPIDEISSKTGIKHDKIEEIKNIFEL